MPARWDGDDRGRGIGDAAQLVPGASELVAAFTKPAWVAEQPEIHLRPHVEGWCQSDQRLALTDAYTDDASSISNSAAHRPAWGRQGRLSSPSSDPSAKVRLMFASAVSQAIAMAPR